uniref:RNA-directed DNA polymerase, eukaryota n=1 Tax=Tanacetum cinerariifolium TaxID=118510 RepID=A0A6L2MC90_TANCI|nr:RNA-directed DNA polymerase, eukaryota [Tanacetum cinerariifolium]
MNDSNPKFPSGFTPQHSDHYEYEKVEALRESTTPQDSKKVRNDQTSHQVLEESVNKSSGVSKTAHAESMTGPVKQRNRFSILERFQEFIDIGQAMGYKMKGCEKDFRRIITSLGDETKMVSLDVFMVKNLWGNMLFDFATSSARGRSGDDFHSVIEDSWNNDGISASNSMILLKNKLKFLKQRLKEWSSIKRRNKDHDRKVIQDSLIEIDLHLDKGNGLPDDLTKRANLFRDLKDIDHKDSIDLAQKAKIKWANLFSASAWGRSLFNVNFPRRLNSDQVFDFEDMVSNEEIKRTRLFNLELQKDANVASKLQASNVATSFRRPSRSGIENSQFIEHGQILSSISYPRVLFLTLLCSFKRPTYKFSSFLVNYSTIVTYNAGSTSREAVRT